MQQRRQRALCGVLCQTRCSPGRQLSDVRNLCCSRKTCIRSPLVKIKKFDQRMNFLCFHTFPRPHLLDHHIKDLSLLTKFLHKNRATMSTGSKLSNLTDNQLQDKVNSSQGDMDKNSSKGSFTTPSVAFLKARRERNEAQKELTARTKSSGSVSKGSQGGQGSQG